MIRERQGEGWRGQIALVVTATLLWGGCRGDPNATVAPDTAVADLWGADAALYVDLGDSDAADITPPADLVGPGDISPPGDTRPVGDAGPPPAFAWVTTGTPDKSHGLALDKAGGVYITGSYGGKETLGTLALNNGRTDQDVFVAKLTPKGSVVWAVTAGGTGDDVGLDIKVDSSGHLLVTGTFQGKASFGGTTVTAAGGDDIFVAKLDAKGKFIWVSSAGGTGPDSGRGVASSSSGHVLVTGEFSGTASFGSKTLSSAGGSDMFAAKYDQSGKQVWAVRAGGKKAAYGSSVDMDAKGSAYVTGSFKDSFTCGANTLSATGLADLFVVKLDDIGRFLWAFAAGGTSYTVGNSIAVNPSGESHVTGWFGATKSGGTAKFGSTTLVAKASGDMLVAKLNSSGKVVWAVAAGGQNDDAGQDIVLDSSGNVYVTGVFNSPTGAVVGPAAAQFGAATIKAKGNREIFVTKLNTQGVFKWAAAAGGVMKDEGTGIDIDNAGGVHITGTYEDTATFGALSVMSNSCFDIFVARLGPVPGP